MSESLNEWNLIPYLEEIKLKVGQDHVSQPAADFLLKYEWYLTLNVKLR